MTRTFYNRFRFLAVLSVAALGTFVETCAGQAYCRSEFHKYFEALGAADARVNPVERFIFSLLLTNAKPEAPAAHLGQNTAKRL
jgi:hypothetical protein